MAIDLIDQIHGYLTPEILNRLAFDTAASESGTRKALAAAVPTLVSALANMASTPNGARQIVSMLDAGGYDGSALDNLAGLLSGGTTTHNILSEAKGYWTYCTAAKSAASST
jgi:hypothetical protein